MRYCPRFPVVFCIEMGWIAMTNELYEKHCWALVDLDAMQSNLALIQKRVGAPVCCVVKADAYGHGAAVAGPWLEENGAAAFAVSCLAEARHLRRHGISKPILILGYTDPLQVDQLAFNCITQTVYSEEYAKALSAAAQNAGVEVHCHFKVDTGMGRIGFSVRSDFEAAIAAMERCATLPKLHFSGIFQHFAVADSTTPENEAYTQAQHALFERTVQRLQADGVALHTIHCANSAAQMRYPEWHHSLTRAGIILYGLDPSPEVHFDGLRPTMTLKSVVTFVKDLLPGESVSYGRTYTANTPRKVATVCVGYADGYPRALSGSNGNPNAGVMSVRGKPAPIIGRVCMDQTLVDVTDIPDVKMNDEVTVFGPENAAIGADTADSIAAKTGTINYEIICGISRRVPRVYLRDGAPVRIWNDLEET